MWRDERGSAASWDQTELGRDNPSSGLPHGIEKRTDPGRQGGNLRTAGAGAPIGTFRMQEIILQIDNQYRGCLLYTSDAADE